MIYDLERKVVNCKLESILEENDICIITIPKRTKSWVKNLPVMDTAVLKKRDGICSNACSKHHEHLTGTYISNRSELAYWKKYTKEIDPSNDYHYNKHKVNSIICWMQLYKKIALLLQDVHAGWQEFSVQHYTIKAEVKIKSIPYLQIYVIQRKRNSHKWHPTSRDLVSTEVALSIIN